MLKSYESNYTLESVQRVCKQKTEMCNRAGKVRCMLVLCAYRAPKVELMGMK